MKKQTLAKAIQITEDIEYLNKFFFLNEACSKITRDEFEKWKQEKIKSLQKEFDKL